MIPLLNKVFIGNQFEQAIKNFTIQFLFFFEAVVLQLFPIKKTEKKKQRRVTEKNIISSKEYFNESMPVHLSGQLSLSFCHTGLPSHLAFCPH